MSLRNDSNAPSGAPRFQAGGALGQGSLYVRRDTDDKLFRALSAGQYCHVLAPRQIGKTSLCMRVADRLKLAGARVAFVDLSLLGTASAFGDWLYAIASEIAHPLDADAELRAFWDGKADIPSATRFGKFLSDILIPRTKEHLVVFLDEIDAVLERGRTEALRRAETNDFFSAIRSLHNQRGRDSALDRLVFCFSGVASPADLVQESGQSPFVVSREIALKDFKRDELSAFEPYLCPDSPDPKALLDEIWSWTSGHPYMTQHLCEEIASGLCVSQANPREVVRAAVDRRFLGPHRHNDVVLSFANNYLSKDNRQFPLTRMLHLYRQLLDQDSIRFDAKIEAHLRLMLAGLAATKEDGGDLFLTIRNRILREAFDKAWVEERESELYLGEPLLNWLHASEEKRPAFVLRGSALRQALDWHSTHSNATPQERDFIEASLQVELREREREIEIERQRKGKEIAELRRKEAEVTTSRTRQYAGLIGALLTILILVIGGAYTRELSQRAELQAAMAKSAEEAKQRLAQEQRFSEALRLEQDARTVTRTAGFETTAGGLPTGEDVLRRALRYLGGTSAQIMVGDPPATRALLSLVNGAPLALAQGSLRGISGRANAAIFSPDGLHLIAGDDGGARLWDLKTGKQVGADLKTSPAEAISGIAVSTDGHLVVLGGAGGALSAHDGSNGQLLKPLAGHGNRVSSIRIFGSNQILTSGEDGLIQIQDLEGHRTVLVAASRIGSETAAVSRNGQWLAAGTNDGKIHLWSGDGKPAGELPAHGAGVNDLSFSPDGAWLVSGSADKTVRLWRVAERKSACAWDGFNDAVVSVAFSSNGALVVAGSNDGTVRVWETAACAMKWASDASSTSIAVARFLADDGLVVAGTGDGFVRAWNAHDGRLLSTLMADAGPVRDLAVSQAGSRIAAAAAEGKTMVWDLPDGRPLVSMIPQDSPAKGSSSGQSTAAYGLRYSRDGKYVLVGYGDGVRAWAADTGERLPAEQAHSGKVRKVVSSPAGGPFATVGADGKAFLWSQNPPFSRTELAMGKQEGNAAEGGCKPIGEGAKGLYAAEIDPRGLFFVAAGADCLVRVWKIGSAEPIAVLPGHKAEVLAVAFSPDGNVVASMDSRGALLVWDYLGKTRKQSMSAATVVNEKEPDPSAVLLFVSNDRLLSGFKLESAKLWDVSTGKLTAELKSEDHWLLGATLAKSGASIVTSSWDQSAKIWDARTGQLQVSLWGHDAPLRKSLFAENGLVVWTSSMDGHLRAFTSGGDLLGEVRAGLDDLWDMDLSPDGRHIAVADARGAVRVYPATLHGFFVQACDLLRGRKSYVDLGDVCGPFEAERP